MSQPPEISNPSPATDEKAQAVRILVVDDEPQMRESLMPFLRRRGFEVAEARDGAQALKVLEDFQAEIIISDICMPILDGIGLLKAVRAEQPDIDVILVTGHADTENAIQAARLRASDYIRKPYDLADLLAVIQRVRRERQLRAEIVVKDLALAEARRMASLGFLAAGIMHEINNPNTFIHGNAIFLRHHLLPVLRHPNLRPLLERLTMGTGAPVSPEEFEGSIKDIQAGSERITVIVNRAIDGLRLGQTGRSTEAVAVVDKAVALVRDKTPANVSISIQMIERPGAISAGEEEILQILVNLLQNAIESFDDDAAGRINVRISEARAVTSVTSLSATASKEIEITVEDNGPGIPESFREKIFLPFFSRKTDRPGRGLGCFIAWQMARNLGGSLRYEPVSPNGSRFIVILPGATENQAGPAHHARPMAGEES